MVNFYNIIIPIQKYFIYKLLRYDFSKGNNIYNFNL